MAEWLVIQIIRILIGCAIGGILTVFVSWPFWLCALICIAIVYGVWIIVLNADEVDL